jgi:hypothetical protein
MRNDVYAEDTHSHSHSGIHNLFAAYFSASPLIFQCNSANFFAFYFGGIRVDFSRFALYFGGIWLCIPFGTTFEQKTYTELP